MTILYQDIKERAVWWFLFPIILMAAGYLHFQQSVFEIFWKQILINIAAFAIIFSLAFIYAVLKLKVNFLREATGLGDLLFFFALSFAFPIGSFLTLLVFSMLFSLMLHLLLPQKENGTTVPLAGYAALFFVFIYLSYWSGYYPNLYQIA